MAAIFGPGGTVNGVTILLLYYLYYSSVKIRLEKIIMSKKGSYILYYSIASSYIQRKGYVLRRLQLFDFHVLLYSYLQNWNWDTPQERTPENFLCC